MTRVARARGLCALALLVGCAAHRPAPPPVVDEHTCDPAGARPPREPRYEAYVADELYPDELALRSRCALPSDPYAGVPDEARLDDERYRLAVAHDPVPLEDAAILERCSGTAGRRAPANPGACRRACVADARARAAHVLFVRIYGALDELARETRTDCAAPGTDVRRCANLEFLPARLRVDTSGGFVRIRGALIPGGRGYELTLAAQDAGCGASEVAPIVTILDPLAGP